MPESALSRYGRITWATAILSWMPLAWSSRYLRLMGRKIDYDVYLLSYYKLKKLLRQFDFHVAVVVDF